MKRSLLFVTPLAAIALLPSAASSQTFAGGSIGPGSSDQRVGTSELGFRVVGSRITIRGAAVIRCRRNGPTEVEGAGSGPLNPDGTFRVTFGGRRLQPTTAGPGYRRRIVVSGQVRGGEIVGRLEATATGGGLRGCRGAFDVLARTAPALGTDPAPPPAGRTLIGMLATPRGPFAVNLRVGPTGGRITHFIAGARYTCRRIRRPFQETNYSPPFRIAADGTFRFVERFRIRYRDAIERVAVTTEGRFVAGGAVGTWRARAYTRSRRTGRIIDRCGTGRLNWSASVV